MHWHRPVAVIGTISLLIGAVTLPAVPAEHMIVPVGACLAVAALLAAWPRSRRWTAPVGIAVGVLSLAVTAWMVTEPRPNIVGPPTSLWMLLEPAVLTVLVYVTVRWADQRPAVVTASLLALATGLQLQRYLWFDHAWEATLGSLMWLFPAGVAAWAAWYLRAQATRRHEAVDQARRRQRLDLAADLHDFVAHDISEIVAQAQAARMVLSPEPRMAEVLDHIESAGQRALRSMDRTVQMLRDTDQAPHGPTASLAELPELVDRFTAAGSAIATLTPTTPPEAPRELAAVAYRVVVEALTNVRRHAPRAERVAVNIEIDDDRLVVTVADDGGSPEPGRRDSGGFGLAGLTERVTSVGGTLEAGPHGGGWRLAARIPLDSKPE